jgi:hypothetical protein
MNKISLNCLSLLAIAGLAHAGTPCDGFEIKIKNDTPDNLYVSKAQLSGGAKLQPSGLITIHAHAEQVFTINNSKDGGKMRGLFKLDSVSIPSKTASIVFDLKNKHLICHHDAKNATGDYPISNSRHPGSIRYTIG